MKTLTRRTLVAGGPAFVSAFAVRAAIPMVSGLGRPTKPTLINLICHGNSITQGQGAGVSYGTLLASKLTADLDIPNTTTVLGLPGCGYIQSNAGVGFPRNLVQDFPVSVVPLLSGTLPNWLISFDGINDNAVAGASPSTAYAAFQNYCSLATAAGIPAGQIVTATVTPSWNGRASWNATYNGLIVADAGAIGYKTARIDLDPCIGPDGQQYDLRYFQPDQTHLTAHGEEIMAEIFCRTMFPG